MKLHTEVLILVFSAAAIFCPAATISCDEFHNGNQYSAYEKMLLDDDKNLIKSEKGFFPTNYRPSIVVDVEYHFIFTNRSTGGSKDDIDLQEQPLLNLTATEISHYHFRWVISPINLFIRPELLTKLSLHTYQTRKVSIDLYLGLPFNCSPEILNRLLNSSASSCDHPPAHLYHLNRLTANLRSYAVHRYSSEKNGLQLNNEQGYSAYFFDDNPSDYCIIDQESDYSAERIYINVGGMILVLAIMLATPVILVSVYESFREKVNNNSNMKYFVWSIATVSFVAAILMLYIVASTIYFNIGLYPKHKEDPGYYDIFIYFTLSAVVLSIMILGDVILMIIALVYVKPVGENSFPIPLLFKVVQYFLGCCGCCCGCCGKMPENQPLLGNDGDGQRNIRLCCSDCLVLLFGCVSFTLFLQLCSFHSVYILLATICTPVTTLSITSFYIATYFCLVAFVAVVLKSTDGIDFKVGAISVLSAILFTICAVLLVLYFYKYTVLVQGYRNTGGIFGIVGSILPSIIVVFGGWCGTKLIKCIKPVRAAVN